jgi:hypothetical protein
MTFVIETGVEIPGRKGGRQGSKYPFAQMSVGQSFLVGSDVKVSTIRSAIGAFSKDKPEYKFAVRDTPEGVRVWRVEAKADGE